MIYEWSKCYLEDHVIYSMPYKHGRREYEEGATTFRLPSNLLWMKQLLVIYQKLAGTIIFMPCVGEKTIFMSCHVWRGATRCRARQGGASESGGMVVPCSASGRSVGAILFIARVAASHRVAEAEKRRRKLSAMLFGYSAALDGGLVFFLSGLI